MENFIVSARKYRPTTFESVVGQQAITQTLQNAIKNNHLAQALLFCGPRGVGKTTCARILAKAINLSDLDKEVSLQNDEDDFAFNIFELDAASNNSVEDIRNLIDQVRFPPQTGKFKVYIIDEVHMLSQAAFNAFLKTLEEPPKHAIFILATTEKHKIIPTILSRCQLFDFNRIQIDDIANHLAVIAKKEGIEAEPDALHVIAQKADGALRDALSMFDQIVSYSGNNITYKAAIDNLNILDYDYYFKITTAVIESNIPKALLVFNEILVKGFDGHNFIVGLEQHFRNLMVCHDPSTLTLLEVGATIRERYNEQAGKCSPHMLLKALTICNQSDVEYRNSKNQRLLVELSLMQLCSIVQEENGVDTAKKKAPSIAPPDPKKLEQQKEAYVPEQPINDVPAEQEASSTLNPTIEPASKVDSIPPVPSADHVEQEVLAVPEPAFKDVVENKIEHSPVVPADPLESVVQEELPVEKPVVNDAVESGDHSHEEASNEPIGDQNDTEESNASTQEPIPETTPARPASKLTNSSLKGKLSNSFSIHDYVEEKEEKNEAEGKDASEENLPKEPFTFEQFMTLWKEMAKEADEEGNYTLLSILNKQPVLQDDFLLELTLDNKAQEEEFEIEKTTIQERLRNSLNNYKISFSTTINKDETKKKAYTSVEKFNKMAEKNPHLNTLKDQLGLEINI